MIYELHRGGHGVMARAFGDEPVHSLAHATVRRVPLRRRAQLKQVHRFARIHFHVEADPVGHHDGVRRDRLQARRDDRIVQIGGVFHDAAPVAAGASLRDCLRFRVAVPCTQWLPLEGQEPVTLQVAKCTVICDHIEPVRGPLERPSRPVPSVAAMADVSPKH
jgi:hypothetical protein